jgi:chaperone BCS1
MNELRKLEKNSRHMYELKSINTVIVSAEDDDESTSGNRYTRYCLSDEKTFESLFFREKEPLLNLVDNFRHRSGRYKVKGYPHKLGVLLHGPPGSGKTSLIKALAQHTGRSIVNVPLARISTNAELQSIFFEWTSIFKGCASQSSWATKISSLLWKMLTLHRRLLNVVTEKRRPGFR